MGPIWGLQDPGGPHVGPMNFAISGIFGDRMILKIPEMIMNALCDEFLKKHKMYIAFSAIFETDIMLVIKILHFWEQKSQDDYR